MNDAIASLLLIILLSILIISPFSALALLMLVLFTTAIISLVTVLVKSVVKGASPQPEKKHRKVAIALDRVVKKYAII